MFLYAFSTLVPSFMYREDHVPVAHPGDSRLQMCGLVLSEGLDYAYRSELHQANQTCYHLHSHIFTRRYPGDVLILKHRDESTRRYKVCFAFSLAN